MTARDLTPEDLDALERAARDRVWIWFADNGNIRKWQSERFEEGTEYLSRAEHDRIIAKQAAAARTLQASTLGQVRHLEEKDRSEYVAAATLNSEREANHRLTEEVRALQAALRSMLKEHDILSGNFGDVMDPKRARPDRWPGAASLARKALAARTKAGEPHEQE